ncbi:MULTISPECIES: hypothetical protein, partial [unclassified Streptococcus]|uniref:hypothetical protein n=1 Tax=unclassified Streptococcus TaxID=2608887 RepID=UPI001ADDA521
RLVQYEKDKEKSQTNLYLLAKTKYKFSVIFQLLASFCPASFLPLSLATIGFIGNCGIIILILMKEEDCEKKLSYQKKSRL